MPKVYRRRLTRTFFSILSIVSIVVAAVIVSAAPRAWGKSGTATNTNTQLTAPFAPTDMCIMNDGAVDLYVDFTDGVAVAADNSTNLLVKAGEKHCWFFTEEKSVSRTFLVGVITAASTTAYRINAWR